MTGAILNERAFVHARSLIAERASAFRRGGGSDRHPAALAPDGRSARSRLIAVLNACRPRARSVTTRLH